MGGWGHEENDDRKTTIFAEGAHDPIKQLFAVDDRADYIQDLMRPPEEWIAEAERAEVRRWKAAERHRRDHEKALANIQVFGGGTPGEVREEALRWGRRAEEQRELKEQQELEQIRKRVAPYAAPVWVRTTSSPSALVSGHMRDVKCRTSDCRTCWPRGVEDWVE